MKKNSRILITGAGGKVGKRLSEILQKNGYKNVRPITRQEVDLTNSDEVNNFFINAKPEYVFMLAAKVGGIQDNLLMPAEYLIENLKLQINVFEAMVKCRPIKCIFACSSGAYPTNSPNPKTEDMFMSGKNEQSNEGYILAKILGVKLAEMLNKQHGLLTISPMIANIYGTYDNYNLDRAHVISSLIKKIAIAKKNQDTAVSLLGTGNARREFIHVDDVVSGLILLMEKYNKNEIINLGIGKDISIKELASLLATKLNYTGYFNWDGLSTEGMKQRLMDSSKIEKIGFKSKISLEEGIDRTIEEFYQLNPDLAC